jgi:Flp pilus assembly protein TadG
MKLLRGNSSISRNNAPRRRRLISRFRQSENGAVTVETVLWLPFFILFMFGVGELGLVFHGQARVLEIAQDTNRAVSVGRFATTTEAEDWAEAALSPFSDEIVATTTVDKGIITTVVTISAGDLAGNIGIFSMLARFDMKVTAQQVWEYNS